MVTASQVKDLREKTGAGMMDCKKVLTEADGDMEKAIELLRERGIAKAAKKSDRVAAEGLVDAYISEDGRTAVKIKNGRVYFGEDSGLNIASSDSIAQAANITSAIQKAINNTATKLSDSNCLYNGTNLADFVRSNFNQ